MTKIVFLGDSLTSGFGVRKAENWVTQAAGKLQIEAVNLGIAGDTTGGLLVRLQTEVIPQEPEFLFVMGGYNDIFFNESDLAARGNIMSIVHQALAKGIIPMLGIPPQIAEAGIKPEWSKLCDFSKAPKLCSGYCQWLRQFSQTFKIPIIDFETEFSRCVNEGIIETHQLDGLHFNQAGHEVMSRIFCNIVGTIIESNIFWN